mmetsp:Transcript_8172/g.32194  ORF Transcript_8172/g.32194 Transcript_8172/m.32194 type:complete len:305 (-) Transcript_8172:201-1115(-)
MRGIVAPDCPPKQEACPLRGSGPLSRASQAGQAAPPLPSKPSPAPRPALGKRELCPVASLSGGHAAGQYRRARIPPRPSRRSGQGDGRGWLTAPRPARWLRPTRAPRALAPADTRSPRSGAAAAAAAAARLRPQRSAAGALGQPVIGRGGFLARPSGGRPAREREATAPWRPACPAAGTRGRRLDVSERGTHRAGAGIGHRATPPGGSQPGCSGACSSHCAPGGVCRRSGPSPRATDSAIAGRSGGDGVVCRAVGLAHPGDRSRNSVPTSAAAVGRRRRPCSMDGSAERAGRGGPCLSAAGRGL